MNKQYLQQNNQSIQEYEDDILKVKKIWNDMKNVNKNNQPTDKSLNKQNIKLKRSSDGKNQQSSKNLQIKKQTVFSSKQNHLKEKINNQELKSTRKTPKQNKNQCNKSIQNTDIIQFSTSGPQGKNQNNNNIKYVHSQLIENNLFNFKNNQIQQNLLNDCPQNYDSKGKSLHTQIYNLRKQIQKKDHQLSIYKVTNRRLQDRMAMLNKQIQQKDKIIFQMKCRQNQLLGQTCKLNSHQLNFEYGKVQYQNFRSDSKRLLKMLQQTQEYHVFANLALDDDGIRFLHNVNKNKKSKIDLALGSNQKVKLHYCTCNKQFLPEIGLWVPDKTYNLAKNFVKDKEGNLTESQVQLLLYELNRYWRQREKKIINSTNALKANQVAKYKRKIQNINYLNTNQPKLVNQQ